MSSFPGAGAAALPAPLHEGRLVTYPWRPAYFAGSGRLFRAEPELLVIHSGANGNDIAGYLEDPVHPEDEVLRWLRTRGGRGGRPWPRNKTRTIQCSDGRNRDLILCSDERWRRPVSAHVSSSCKDGGFVQQVDLLRQSWDCGGSTWCGRKGVNACNLSIELPAHQGQDLRRQFTALITMLVQVVRALKYWCRHLEIKRGKRDPPPYFTDDWMCCSELEHRY